MYVSAYFTRYARRYGILSAILVAGLSGCSSEVLTVSNPEDAFLWVTMNTRAAVLTTTAPTNTIQLSATAYRGDSTPIPGVVTTFSVSDESLTVTETGLVTAVQPTLESYVTVRITFGGVTRTATTYIVAVANPFTLETFSLSTDPAAPIVVGKTSPLTMTAIDHEGTNVSDLIPVAFTSSDPALAVVDRSGFVTATGALQAVSFTATVTVFGVTYTDSIEIAIGYPQFVEIGVVPQRTADGRDILVFVPSTVFISPGGTVQFGNLSGGGLSSLNTKPIDVVFSNPEAAQPSSRPFFPTGAGNIAPMMATGPSDFLLAFQTRSFPAAGTITYRSELYGTTGTIHVR